MSNEVEVRVKVVADPSGFDKIKRSAKTDGEATGNAFSDGLSTTIDSNGRMRDSVTGRYVAGAKGDGTRAGQDFGSGLDEGVSSKVGGISGKIGDMLKVGLAGAGLAAGALLVGGLNQALDNEVAVDKLTAQLGGSEWAASMGEVAGNLYGNAFGDSIGDAAEAVKAVVQNGFLPEDATNDQIEAMTAKLMTFTDVLDQDMDMTTQAISNMIRTGIADSSEEAFDILTRGIQQGADRGGDLIETFQEYSTIFREIGLSAEDATGLMSQGLQAGARDADTVSDALKEFAIRAQDGSKTSREAFDAIGVDAEAAMISVAAGGDSARIALDMTLDALRNMEDPVARNAAAVGLFGTKAEDLGDALFSLDLDTAADMLGDTAGATDKLGSAYDNAATNIESFKRKAIMGLTSALGGVLLPALGKISGFLMNSFGPTFETVSQVAQAFWNALTVGENFGGGGIFDTVGKFGALLHNTLVPAFNTGKAAFKEFMYTLTSGFFEDEGTPIERFALKIREFALVLINDVWPAVKDFVSKVVGAIRELYPQIKETVEKVISVLGSWYSFLYVVMQRAMDIITVVLQVITTIWNKWGEEITAVVVRVFSFIFDVIKAALDIIQGIIRTVTAVLQGDWAGAWDGIKQILSGAWDAIVAVLSLGWDLVKVLFEKGIDLIQYIWSNAWDWIKSAAGAAWDGIVALLGMAWDKLVQLFENRKEIAKAILDALWETIKNAASLAWDLIIGLLSMVWDEIVTLFTDKTGIAESILNGAWELMKSGASLAWDALKAILSAAWDEIVTIVTGDSDIMNAILDAAWAVTKAVAQAGWDALKALIAATWEGIKTLASNQVENVKTLLSNAWESMKATASAAWEALKGAVQRAIDSVVASVSGFAGRIRGAAAGAWDGLIAGLAPVVNKGIDLINRLIAAYNAMPGVPDIGTISRIPTASYAPAVNVRPTKTSRATGGVTTDGLTRWAENGEEIAKFPNGTMIFSNPDTERMLASVGASSQMSSGPSTVIVNVYGSLLTERDLTDLIREQIEDNR